MEKQSGISNPASKEELIFRSQRKELSRLKRSDKDLVVKEYPNEYKLWKTDEEKGQ
jgi:hypothetical protein